MNIFLTAYDPSDLPGGSIDPMGFEAGYLQLAEEWLPHLTNVANRPRYFGVLCSGVLLAQVTSAMSPRDQALERQAAAQRLERLWLVANVLASEDAGEDRLPTGGLRGISYARDRARRILEEGQKQTDSKYKLLSRQTPYGLIGIYAAVADRLRLINRKGLILTPDLGESLGEAFIEETQMPKAVQRSTAEDTSVSVSVLAEWGARAHVAKPVGDLEAEYLMSALRAHPQRMRAAELAKKFPSTGDEDTELDRLARMRASLGPSDDVLRGLLDLIDAYEDCYRHTMVVFERALWLGRSISGGEIRNDDLVDDAVISDMRSNLSAVIDRFAQTYSACSQPDFHAGNSNLRFVESFLNTLRDSLGDNVAMVDAVLSRHKDVQQGKFDRGQRKAPWIERNGSAIALTMAPSTNRTKEITQPNEIAPHEYRTESVDWFLHARGALELVS